MTKISIREFQFDSYMNLFKKEQMSVTVIVHIRKCWALKINNKPNLDIRDILVVFPKIRQIEVFDVTNKFPQSLGTSLNEGSTSYRFIES